MSDIENRGDAPQDAGSRFERRRFLQLAGTAGVVAGGLTILSACGGSGNAGTVTPTPTPSTTASTSVGDTDVLNFALNLEYLQASFFSQAGLGLALGAYALEGNVTPGITGVGPQGTVTGGRAVAFTDQALAQIAREFAYDAAGHVAYLRSGLSTSAVAIPAINIAGDATGAFTAVMQAAGVIAAGATFDPYASEANFLLAAFVLADPAVAAYRGVATTFTSKTLLEGAAGMLATNAYHAGTIRLLLSQRAASDPTIAPNVQKISDWRDSIDGAADTDQGITGTATVTNIVAADSNALAFGRSAAQTLNILYASKAAVTQGGFFPSGINGNVKTSAAN
jgi:hypothetical protein